MTRLALVDHRRRICFFHSPKCASRSLSEWLMRHVLLTSPTKGKADLVQRVFGADMRSAASLVTDHGYLSVALVRHPATRLLSAFGDRIMSLRYGDADVGDGGQPKACENTERSYPEFEGKSFSDLLDHVSDHLRMGEHSELQPRYNQQIHPRHDLYGMRFDHVCALETLQQDFAPIEDYYGVPGTFPQARPKSRLATPIGAERFDPEVLLTPNTLTRIGRLFARDFEVLGYDPDNPLAPPALRRDNGAIISHGGGAFRFEPIRERKSAWSWFGLRRA